MHTDSGMTGISLSGCMPYMTVASLEMSDEPNLIQETDVIATKKGDEAIYYLIVKK